ncbi:MAG TPA: hypothetical protein VFI73_07995 [Candidatus Nitrosopolaris sp.]|nr:hypothetical protein [Candidatus Nitrosopolaris sp.]
MLESQLHFISAIAIFLAAVVPIYLTTKLKDNLRKLTLILTVFILAHGAFHVIGFFGFNLLAEGVFEPLSVALLIFFGIVYSGIAKSKEVKNMMVIVWNPGTLLLLMNSITSILLLVAWVYLYGWQCDQRISEIFSFKFQYL